jgi:hypothetical protein
MGEIINIEENLPHSVSEVICLKCLDRWVAVYPTKLTLKELSCVRKHKGFVIKTGQDINP